MHIVPSCEAFSSLHYFIQKFIQDSSCSKRLKLAVLPIFCPKYPLLCPLYYILLQHCFCSTSFLLPLFSIHVIISPIFPNLFNICPKHFKLFFPSSNQNWQPSASSIRGSFCGRLCYHIWFLRCFICLISFYRLDSIDIKMSAISHRQSLIYVQITSEFSFQFFLLMLFNICYRGSTI